MKSPSTIAQGLARQWLRTDWREAHVLSHPGAWPLRLSIGWPNSQIFTDQPDVLRQHLQQWTSVDASQIGQVQWAARNFRGSTCAIDIPTHWLLAKPSDYVHAVQRFAGSAQTEVTADYQALLTVLGKVDPCFRAMLVRRLPLWRHSPADDVVQACQMALQLEPGCAQGRPLRALSLQGNDSKFFERYESLLKALLDVRFQGEASRQGLTDFLGATRDAEHWLLVLPMDAQLLPFPRLRLSSQTLRHTPLPASHLLLVENEQCAHQLPSHLPGTVAVLGAGLDLDWLQAPWLSACRIGYWGDIDSWGLQMLAMARQHQPTLQPLLMDIATFAAHAPHAVPEPVHATLQPHWPQLTAEEQHLALHLLQQEKGRLEQEFLPTSIVAAALAAWHRG